LQAGTNQQRCLHCGAICSSFFSSSLPSPSRKAGKPLAISHRVRQVSSSPPSTCLQHCNKSSWDFQYRAKAPRPCCTVDFAGASRLLRLRYISFGHCWSLFATLPVFVVPYLADVALYSAFRLGSMTNVARPLQLSIWRCDGAYFSMLSFPILQDWLGSQTSQCQLICVCQALTFRTHLQVTFQSTCTAKPATMAHTPLASHRLEAACTEAPVQVSAKFCALQLALSVCSA